MLPRDYRSIPVTVQAMQFTKEKLEGDFVSFTGGNFRLVAKEDRGDDPEIVAEVFDTLHNTWVGVKLKQWIIRGTKGEFYPCDPDVFKQKYNEA